MSSMPEIIPIYAAGNSQATARQIGVFDKLCLGVQNVMPGTGIILPPCQAISEVLMYNTGANDLTVYPPLGGTIDYGPVNGPFTLAAGSKAIFYSVFSSGGPIDWFSFTGGTGGSYAPPAFLSFSISGQASPIEVGATIASGNKTFLWSTSNSANVQANSISIYDSTASTVLASGLANTGSDVISISAITNVLPATQTWQINGVNTHLATFSDTYSVVWEWKVFAGISTNVVLNGAQIYALSASANLQANFPGRYNIPSGSVVYYYFAYPDSFGDVIGFVDGNTGFPISMATSIDNAAYSNVGNGWSYDLVAVTNTNSITTNYRLYRTQNNFSGTLLMVVN